MTVRTCHSLSSFKRKLHVYLRQLHMMDCDRKLGEREKDKEIGSQVIAIAMTAHVRPTFYTH